MWIAGFLLLLGPLVTIHELGHYLVGRWFGVKADAFSIGFGKELAGWTDRRGTRWKLSLLPLGGYVQFAGDMSPVSQPSEEWMALPPEERAKTFQAQPLWQRTLIVAAGPVTNLLFAVAIFACFNMAYGRVLSSTEVFGFDEVSDARDAGVRAGDRIVAIDGHKVASEFDVSTHVTAYPGRTVKLDIERAGQMLRIPVKLQPRIESDPFGNKGTVGELGVDFTAPVVGRFIADSAAKAAGIEAGDRIAAVDGTAIASYHEVGALVRPHPGKTVQVTIARPGRTFVVPVTLGAIDAPGPDGRKTRVGLLGVMPSPGETVRVGPVEAVTMGVGQSAEVVQMMAAGIGQIFTGERSVRELGGPVKMAQLSGEQLSLGWDSFVSFVALISINLGFINLLPIPALDGGHLAFYAAEAVRRKPVGPRSQEWAFRTGVALVLALMLFVTINDIASLPVFGK
jgi:regulator of sigma E protease